ncbi:MAG: CbiQ family ECF transporter T component, partial [Spirochaetales bacterium]|nr:CbiQ family ECF transporter T component [Spirochaetales bacterium]
QPREGVGTVLLLSGSSLSLQLFLAFFPQKSLYLLLRQAGCPEKPAFIAYCTVNYTLMVKPVIIEIQDAQRLRGMEIPRGIRAIFHLKGILIPLMIRLLKGADHLAESLTLRGRDQ